MVKYAQEPTTFTAEVTMCSKKLFARLQKLYQVRGVKAPQMPSDLESPGPNTEEGERMRAEGALACKDGNMRKKRKFANVVDLAEPVKLRLVGTDSAQLTIAQSALFNQGFRIEWITAPQVLDEDITFEKLVIFLQMIKAVKNPLNWNKDEKY